MIEDIKMLLGLTSDDKDELLELLIKLATQTAEHITGESDSTRLKSAIIKMVVFDYNRLGTEGLSAENYNGASFTYTDDYPAFILDDLNAIKNSLKVLW